MQQAQKTNPTHQSRSLQRHRGQGRIDAETFQNNRYTSTSQTCQNKIDHHGQGDNIAKVRELNQISPTVPISTANNMALIRLAKTSRQIRRQVLDAVRSLEASARTATVKLCVPALPPIDAMIGIKIASARKLSIVASN